MSDERARQRQRSALLGGVEEEARELAERVRREECGRCQGGRETVWVPGAARIMPDPGERIPMDICPDCGGLSVRERVELAAFCGHAPALLVVAPGVHHWCLRCAGPVWMGDAHDCTPDRALLALGAVGLGAGWARELHRWGRLVPPRAWLAAIKAGAGYSREANSLRLAAGLNTITKGVETWLACPCQYHAPPQIPRGVREPFAVTFTDVRHVTAVRQALTLWALGTALREREE